MNKKRENFIFIYGKNSHNFESIKIINILTQVQEFAWFESCMETIGRRI